MPDLPEEAVQAAARAIERELMSGRDYSMAVDSDEALARAALEAAAPLLAEQIRRETAEQIADSIEQRGDALTLDCWCHDWAADLARQIGESPR